MNDSDKPWISSRIGFSSFGVLVYYAIANAAAWTLTPAEGRPARIVPVVGLAGSVIMAFALPVPRCSLARPSWLSA
jgi:APA family basic amino acid/polyamine antiporter